MSAEPVTNDELNPGAGSNAGRGCHTSVREEKWDFCRNLCKKCGKNWKYHSKTVVPDLRDLSGRIPPKVAAKRQFEVRNFGTLK